MLLKYFGKKIGGWIRLEAKPLYYFYFIRANLSHGKVMAKVITNID